MGFKNLQTAARGARRGSLKYSTPSPVLLPAPSPYGYSGAGHSHTSSIKASRPPILQSAPASIDWSTDKSTVTSRQRLPSIRQEINFLPPPSSLSMAGKRSFPSKKDSEIITIAIAEAPNAPPPMEEGTQAMDNLQKASKSYSVYPIQDILDSQIHQSAFPETSTIETSRLFNISDSQTISESLTDGHDRNSSPYSNFSSLTTPRELNSVAQKLISDLVGRIVTRCVELSKGQIYSCMESNSASSTSTQQQRSDSTPATNFSGSLKRHRESDGKDDEEECPDDDDTRRQAKRNNRKMPKKARLWACPYTKFDPIRYSEHNQQDEKGYRKCASATLMNISTVKQHLRRIHLEPKYFCGNCFESFKDKKDLLQHNQVTCQKGTPRYQEMMTEEQYHLIPGYLADTVSSWNQIFQILFKDRPLPASPYVSHCDTAVLEQFIALFRFVGPSEFLGLLSSRPKPNDLLLESNLSLQNLIEETYQSAFPEYLQQLRGLANENSTNGHQSIIIENPQFSTCQNSDSRILEASTNAQSTVSRPLAAHENAEVHECLPNLSTIEEAFTSFEANLYSESYFQDNESWMNDFPTAFDDATSNFKNSAL